MSSKMVTSQHIVAAVVMIMGLIIGLDQAPSGAVAQTNHYGGTACMFFAPSGAPLPGPKLGTVVLPTLGHVGWGIQDPVAGVWFFGATEDSGGNLSIAKGGFTQTWIANGTMNDMLTAFMNSKYFHQAGYYASYRCFYGVQSYSIPAALAAQANGAESGFNAFNDNCLTKSILIFDAYGDLNNNPYSAGLPPNENIPTYPKLTDGLGYAPNTYYLFTLGIDGWGLPIPLPYPPGIGCMFNAPSGATVAEGLGQVGWGFLDPFSGNWYYGATENFLGNTSAPANAYTQSWISSGSQTSMFQAFRTQDFVHPANYYVSYACNNVSIANVGGALNTQALLSTSGYDAAYDNCLTKATAILYAYGETSLVYAGSVLLDLEPVLVSPNLYFNSLWTIGWPYISLQPIP